MVTETTRKMRVGVSLGVQLVSKPTGLATGIGRYAAELARGMGDTDIQCRQPALWTQVPHPLMRVGHRFGYDIEAFLRSYPVRADARQGYVTHLTSQTLATLLLTQRLPRPVVVTVHDILPYVLRDDPELCVYRNRIDRLMDRLAMRGVTLADRLIADSHYTKKTLVEHLSIPPDRIDVIHLGVDTARFRQEPVPESFRQQYGLTENARYVLFVGTEDPRKDLPTLLRATTLLRQGGLNVTLLKVGAPAFLDQRKRHLELCEELNLGSAVRWFDEVPDEDLPRFYCVADVFAFPSRYEGFGFPILEALACGTPVVAARASSVPELVGNLGRLVEPARAPDLAAAIMETLQNPKPTVAELSTHLARFRWDRTIAQTQASYQAAIRFMEA